MEKDKGKRSKVTLSPTVMGTWATTTWLWPLDVGGSEDM